MTLTNMKFQFLVEQNVGPFSCSTSDGVSYLLRAAVPDVGAQNSRLFPLSVSPVSATVSSHHGRRREKTQTLTHGLGLGQHRAPLMFHGLRQVSRPSCASGIWCLPLSRWEKNRMHWWLPWCHHSVQSSPRSATDFQQVPWFTILTFEHDCISLLNGLVLFGPNAVWPWK